MTAGRAVQVERWDVFAREPGGGNPCYLIRGLMRGPVEPDPEAEAAHAVARHYGGEAALVSAVSADGAGTARSVGLRFFSPGGEMAMCVHASIAAVTALVTAGELSGREVTARTRAGECAIGWDGSMPPVVSVEQPAPRIGPSLDLAAEVAQALGLPVERVGGRLGTRLASGSRPKLLIPLADAAAVHAARPAPERLQALCRRIEATGCYVFAPHPDGRAGHLVARQFPVDAGIVEDAATGVAAGALAAYLSRRADAAAGPAAGSDADSDSDADSAIDIDQGDAMGRPSRLTARALTAGGVVRRTEVAGRARFILRETVRF